MYNKERENQKQNKAVCHTEKFGRALTRQRHRRPVTKNVISGCTRRLPHLFGWIPLHTVSHPPDYRAHGCTPPVVPGAAVRLALWPVQTQLTGAKSSADQSREGKPPAAERIRASFMQ